MATRNVNRSRRGHQGGPNQSSRGSTRVPARAQEQCRAIQASSPFLYDLSATLWERLTKDEQDEWMAQEPEAATEAKNEKRRSIY